MQKRTTNLFRFKYKIWFRKKGKRWFGYYLYCPYKIIPIIYYLCNNCISYFTQYIFHVAISSIESEDADRFIRESNLSIIQRYVENNIDDPDEKVRDVVLDENNSSLITGLGKHMCVYIKNYITLYFIIRYL